MSDEDKSELIEYKYLNIDDDDADGNAGSSGDDDGEHIQQDKRLIYRKVIIVSCAFLVMFTAYNAMQDLQSSINREGNIGTVSVSVIYITIVLTALLIPLPMISVFGYKWTMVLSMTCYVTYMVMNFYPSWWTLLPASIIIGLGASPLWTAQMGLFAALGRQYAKLSQEETNVVVTRFFTIFFMFFQCCKFPGNLISSIILSTEVTKGSISEEALLKCGANMCTDPVNNTNLERPSQEKFFSMMSIFLGCSILATVIIAVFLPNEKGRDAPRSGNIILRNMKNSLIATYNQAFDVRLILLWPVTIYSGLQAGYISGDYTKAYVSCALGIKMVGYVMMCFGGFDAVFSWLTGKLREFTGRIPIFVFGAILNYAMQVLMLLWAPHPSQLPVFFVISGCWGAGDAIWQAHVKCVYGGFFGVNSDPAFSYLCVMESVGFFVAFAYSGYLCTSTKLYILIVTLSLSMICYVLAEYINKKRTKQNGEILRKCY